MKKFFIGLMLLASISSSFAKDSRKCEQATGKKEATWSAILSVQNSRQNLKQAFISEKDKKLNEDAVIDASTIYLAHRDLVQPELEKLEEQLNIQFSNAIEEMMKECK